MILERTSREHVLARVRAGVLEQGTVDLLDEAKAGARLHEEGLPHDGISLAFDGRLHRIDLDRLSGGKHVTIYGQTEVTRDLMDRRDAAGLTSVFEASNVLPQDFGGEGAVRHLRQGWGEPADRLRLHRRLRRLSRRQPQIGAAGRHQDVRAAVSVRLAGRARRGAAGRP